jgi:phosphoribosylformylglycinamidine (FGAM) synthase-like enzyme
MLGPGGDAGVFKVAETDFALAVTLDCNARLVAIDPYEGGKATVAEAARNVAVTGAKPLGITDCLNFGNPEKPEVFHQFKEACRGISDACRAFGIPVTGGNVSFYNERSTSAVDPTPTVGLVGLLARAEDRVPSHFQREGDGIVIFGVTTGALGGSAYWTEVHDFIGGAVATVDLEAEARLQRFLVEAASAHLLRSAHDCSQGGLAVALAEAAMGGPYSERPSGADIDLTGYAPGCTDEQVLYAEDHGRVVATFDRSKGEELAKLARKHGVPGFGAGRVTGPEQGFMIKIGRSWGGPSFHWAIEDLRRTYFEAIPRRMSGAEMGA